MTIIIDRKLRTEFDNWIVSKSNSTHSNKTKQHPNKLEVSWIRMGYALVWACGDFWSAATNFVQIWQTKRKEQEKQLRAWRTWVIKRLWNAQCAKGWCKTPLCLKFNARTETASKESNRVEFWERGASETAESWNNKWNTIIPSFCKRNPLTACEVEQQSARQQVQEWKPCPKIWSSNGNRLDSDGLRRRIFRIVIYRHLSINRFRDICRYIYRYLSSFIDTFIDTYR